MELEVEPSFLNLETFAAPFHYRSNNLPGLLEKKKNNNNPETECLFSQEIQNEVEIPQNSCKCVNPLEVVWPCFPLRRARSDVFA